MSGHATLRRTKTWVLLGAVVGALALPAAVGAAEPGIRACVRQQGGAVRIVTATATCAAGETLVVWDRSGPVGPTGAGGAAGSNGQNGQNGQNGSNGGGGKDGGAGPAGAAGAAGAAGPQGVVGPTGPQGVAGPPGSDAERTPTGQESYMRCTGIDGGSTTPGFAKFIEVLSYSHGIVSPRDSASGQATGKRQHKPLTITKEIDKATPLLFSRLVNNQTIPQCTLTFLHKFAGAPPEAYFTITLTNAQVSEVASSKGDTRKLDERQLNETEEVSFTYQKITWTYVDGGITAEDDWQAPVT